MATTTPLTRYPLSYPDPTARYLLEAWWTCPSSPGHTWKQRSDCVLSTGEPFSVLPPTVRDSLDPEILPVRGWKGKIPTWYGQPCRIGRATLWLPAQEDGGLLHALSLLVLLPRQEPPDIPPFALLGTQFLLEHRARVILDSTVPGGDRLVCP
jgi:hypothetical protein